MNLRRLLPVFFDKMTGKKHSASDDGQPKGADKKPGTPAHLLLGKEGEDAATALLTRKGYAILDRNWRQARLELDIVCRDGDTIVFVEVKTRGSNSYGGPIHAVGNAKQRTLCRAARAWLSAHEAWDQPCRFDVICALRNGSTLHLEHFCHAFDCPPALDSRHTSWQPW